MRSLLLGLFLLTAACKGDPRPKSAVVIYTNAAIHTMTPGQKPKQAMAVRGDRILAVGDKGLLTGLYEDARVVELEGACVVPGLIDSHGHLASLAQLKLQLDLRDTKSYDEMLQRVKDRAAATPKGAWILGGRWDQADWGSKQLPHHRALSAVTPDHPALLSRVDGHAALANAAALARAGITRDTKDPPGGEIVRDESGEPTGILVDNAVDLVRGVVPQGGGRPIAELWKTAQRACFEVGLTCVHDAGVARADIEELRERYANGEFKLRVHVMLSDGKGMADYLRKNRPRSGPRFSVRALKLYVDGAMGSRGAWMLEPYSDRPSHSGLNVMPLSRLRELAFVAARTEWQVCTHAIGDRANREVLDAYEAAFFGLPKDDRRFRVEHAQCVSEADMPRFRPLGVIASMQPTHATSDMRWAEDRVGPERIKGCYAWQTLRQYGVRLAFGSDFPVESENPLWGIYAAITRQDHDGSPERGWREQEKLSRTRALALFTIEAAHAAFREHDLGSLRAGKLADFVVLDRDIMTVEPKELLKTRVLRTVIGGETVYEASR